jgi:hypothetical protein
MCGTLTFRRAPDPNAVLANARQYPFPRARSATKIDPWSEVESGAGKHLFISPGRMAPDNIVVRLTEIPLQPPGPDPKSNESSDGGTSPTQPAPDSGSVVDQMSENSFPASDPPAVWTWDVPPRA